MSVSGCAHSKVLVLPSVVCSESSWLSLSALLLAAAGWQEEGQKELVSVRTEITMKSFKGQQQLKSHLEDQRQPAHLAEQQWDTLCTKPSAHPAGGHCLAFQMASKATSRGSCCCTLKWQWEEKLYHDSHPNLPGQANADGSPSFGFAAKRAAKFPKLWAQSTNPWLCTPGPSICACHPALWPSPAVTQPGCPHPGSPHYSCCYYGTA